MTLLRKINEALSEPWPGKYRDDDELWPEDKWVDHKAPSGVVSTLIGHNRSKGQFRTHLGYTSADLNPDGSARRINENGEPPKPKRLRPITFEQFIKAFRRIVKKHDDALEEAQEFLMGSEYSQEEISIHEDSSILTDSLLAKIPRIRGASPEQQAVLDGLMALDRDPEYLYDNVMDVVAEVLY